MIVKLQSLRRDFESLEMKGSESIDQYTNCVISKINQLDFFGEEMMSQKVVKKVLGRHVLDNRKKNTTHSPPIFSTDCCR